MLTASFAAQGLDYQPCSVVVHEDGSVTYIGGCADSTERVAEVNAINKAKREKEAAQQKASMAEFFANCAVDISRITYTASPEILGSAIAAYEKNIMEVAGSLNR